MPGEGAISSLLQKFLEEFEKVRGKDENAFVEAWEANRGIFDQLPEGIRNQFQKMYAKVKTLIALGNKPDSEYIDMFIDDLKDLVDVGVEVFQKGVEPPSKGVTQQGSTRPYRKKFDKCVKAVRTTVKVRPGSSKESAAIAICTKSVLQTRGRTMKKYRKGRLTTQKKRV